MNKYPKIESLFNRDTENFKFIIGEYRLPEFEYLKDNEWIFTEKINGTNIRVIFNHEMPTDKSRLGHIWVDFRGRTDRAQIPKFLEKRLKEMFYDEQRIDKMLEIFKDTDVCLYGEGYGAKIQKGGGNYISNGVDFILIDIKIGNWWLKREDVIDIAQQLDLKVVPEVGRGTLDDGRKLIQNGLKSQWGDFLAEGIVAKPKIEMLQRNSQRIITKIKHRDFLEKE